MRRVNVFAPGNRLTLYSLRAAPLWTQQESAVLCGAARNPHSRRAWGAAVVGRKVTPTLQKTSTRSGSLLQEGVRQVPRQESHGEAAQGQVAQVAQDTVAEP